MQVKKQFYKKRNIKTVKTFLIIIKFSKLSRKEREDTNWEDDLLGVVQATTFYPHNDQWTD